MNGNPWIIPRQFGLVDSDYVDVLLEDHDRRMRRERERKSGVKLCVEIN